MSSAPRSKNVVTELSAASPADAEGGAAPAAVPALPRKIIYTGSVALRTDDLDAAARNRHPKSVGCAQQATDAGGRNRRRRKRG